MKVPVVLGGSVYKGSCPLLIDELVTVLHRTAPRAYVKVPALPPVAGAYFLALDTLGIEVDEKTYNNVERSLKL